MENTNAKLYQNTPNPFSQKTEIRYFLADEINYAMILIFDMSGKQVKQYDLTIKGDYALTIHGNELSPGMYTYSLIADNKLIDTKKMILTH
jgi:hypothetical protein